MCIAMFYVGATIFFFGKISSSNNCVCSTNYKYQHIKKYFEATALF